MKTIELAQGDMAARVARFSELKPLPTQSNGAVPQEARDIIYARKIFSVIGLEGASTPINMGAPTKGAGGMTMAIAVCPPGQGPELHNHRQTFETFTVLRGRFETLPCGCPLGRLPQKPPARRAAYKKPLAS